jgi:hypothetical protein
MHGHMAPAPESDYGGAIVTNESRDGVVHYHCCHPPHQAGDRRDDVPPFRWFGAVAILREQGSRLIELVLGGVILKFRCIAIRCAHGELGALKRLRGRCAALRSITVRPRA